MTRIADSYHIGWDILCYDRSGTDGHVVADGDLCLVKHSEMEIGKETLAHADLLAVVAIERLIDDDLVVSNVAKQTF